MILTERLILCGLLTEVKVLRDVTVCSSESGHQKFRWAPFIELNRAMFCKAEFLRLLDKFRNVRDLV